MKKLLLFLILFYSCTPQTEEKPKVSTKTSTTYHRVKNKYHKKVLYKDAIELYLKLLLDDFLKSRNLKLEDLSQQKLDQFNLEYLTDAELLKYEDLIRCEIHKLAGVSCSEPMEVKITPDTLQPKVKIDSVKPLVKVDTLKDIL